MKVTKKQLEALKPYFSSDGPSSKGEVDLHCPLHRDGKRSAQLNVETGVWFCNAGCGGGKVAGLMKVRDSWVPPPAERRGGGVEPTLSERDLKRHRRRLVGDDALLSELAALRGISTDAIRRAGIGYDDEERCFVLPVRNLEGELVNVRKYVPRPSGSMPKMRNTKGFGKARLYPIEVIDHDEIIFCEGEWDALVTTDRGFPAITNTDGAGKWNPAWGPLFEGKVVYVCFDRDATGVREGAKIARLISKWAKEVRVVELPFELVEKAGLDLSDFWRGDGTKARFRRLLAKAPAIKEEAPAERRDPSDANVLDALDAEQFGNPLRLTVTVKGRSDPGFSVPRKVEYECTMDAGEKCAVCPLKELGGSGSKVISRKDPVVLEMTGSTKRQLDAMLLETMGIPKCDRVDVEVTDHQAVEILFAQPSVAHVNGGMHHAQFKTIRLTSVGRHDTPANNTVEVVGALQANPRTQSNEFLAWAVDPLETGIDSFELSKGDVLRLRETFGDRRDRPLLKVAEIAAELASRVTHIYGRDLMHAAMDLTWHSALAFRLGAEEVRRGWLELLVVGDTRTGKSEVAHRLAQHFNAGAIATCETTTLPGILGGVQQLGSSQEWAVTWGIIPLNDRRLVVLDEVGSLTHDEIGSLSDVRSSGIARLTKVVSEETFARTRLIWMGNPRDRRMSDYAFGVQAVEPLIGRHEDIARFDLAMSVASEDVPSTRINAEHEVTGEPRFTPELCSLLLRWIWSRKPEEVVFSEGAVERIRHYANVLGGTYIDRPPLVQAANVRLKIARLAAAIAGRTFATDDGKSVRISRQHVDAAVQFMRKVYDSTSFGYGAISGQAHEESRLAVAAADEARRYLEGQPALGRFLATCGGSFRRQDIEEVLNVQRDQANATINRLWQFHMVRKVKGDVYLTAELNRLLRRMQ